MENCLVEEKATEKGSIPYGIIKCISKGIARVEDNGVYTVTLMKLAIEEDKIFYYLVTCAHCINEDAINSKSKIDVFYGELENEKNIKIKLDKEERFIKCYKNEEKLDITVVQTFDKEITEDKNFLMPSLDYKNGYKTYKNKTIFIGGYPHNQNNNKKLEESDFSNGEILRLKDNYFFEHNCSTYKGSSGSPLTDINKKLVGIHNSGHSKKIRNAGTFIGPIIEDLLKNKNNMKSKSKSDFEENLTEQENDTNLFLNQTQLKIYIQNINNNNNNKKYWYNPFCFKIILSLIFICPIFFLIMQSCFMRKKTILYHNNGKKKFDGFTKMGLYDGLGKEFNENETLIYDGNFKKGKKDGEGKSYYDNGTLRYNGNYTNDKFNGIGKLYEGKGRILYDGEWLEGQRHGFGIEYYKNGNKHHEGYWKYNELNGFAKTYYQRKNDLIEQFDRCEEFPSFDEEQEIKYNRAYNKHYEYICYEGNYTNGTKNGKGIFFYINEVEKYNGEWENGKKNGWGLLRDFYGYPIYQGYFVDNVKTSGTLYDKNRNVYLGHFINEKLEGYGQIEYKKEKCLIKGYFSGGILNGTTEIWLKDSIVEKMLLSGNIWNGKFEGISTIYKDGNEIDIFFINGKQYGKYMITNEKGEIDFKDEEDNYLIMEAFNKCSIFKNLTSSS